MNMQFTFGPMALKHSTGLDRNFPGMLHFFMQNALSWKLAKAKQLLNTLKIARKIITCPWFSQVKYERGIFTT